MYVLSESVCYLSVLSEFMLYRSLFYRSICAIGVYMLSEYTVLYNYCYGGVSVIKIVNIVMAESEL